MTEEVAYCGYRCDLCAARSDDPAVRQRLVDGWRKIYGHERYTVENVRCDGCRAANGRLADLNCQARPCAIERGVESCALCEDFICDKVRCLMTSERRQRAQLADVSDDEYALCCQQFDSIPRLIRIRESLGLETSELRAMEREFE